MVYIIHRQLWNVVCQATLVSTVMCWVASEPRKSSLSLICNASAVQRRHPLALGHYANHPPPGVQPNVQVAAYDYAMGVSGQPLLALKLRQMTCDSS